MNLPSAARTRFALASLLVIAGMEPSALRAADTANADSPDSAPVENWYVVKPVSTQSYTQVVWAGTQFVAVGQSGVSISPDGITWTDLPVKSPPLFGVAANDTLCVAVGADATFLASRDLTNWTPQSAPTAPRRAARTAPADAAATPPSSTATTPYNGVLWSGNEFVALGDLGSVATSPDGMTWTRIFRQSRVFFHRGVWDGTKFVVTSANGLWTSPDGKAWNKTLSLSARTYDIVWNGHLFVAVGDAAASILTSPDGLQWGEPQLKLSLRGAAWTGQQFVVVGENSLILTSPDGSAWTRRPCGVDSDLQSVACHGNVLVAVGANGIIVCNQAPASNSAATALPTDWTNPPVAAATAVATDHWSALNPKSAQSFNRVIWEGTQFVAVGSSGISTSPDGINWTDQHVTSPPLFDAAANDTLCVAVGDKSTFLTSTDLINWAPRNTTRSPRYYGLLWAGNKFVALGDRGNISTSPDGMTWTSRTPTVDAFFHHGIWDGGKFVATSGDGLWLSLDGVSWQKTLNLTARTYDVAWNGHVFVAVGDADAGILTSPDGLQWSKAQVKFNLHGVTWTGRQFIVVGENSVILTSPDGNAWTRSPCDTITNLQSVASHGNMLVAVSDTGIILYNQASASNSASNAPQPGWPNPAPDATAPTTHAAPMAWPKLPDNKNVP
jgi:hypothetical protein